MNDPGEIEQIATRVEALERRVTALERGQEKPALPPDPLPVLTSSSAQAIPEPLEAISVSSVLGKAMLGIAGAYLLRAAAQSNLMPSQAAAAIGVPYALLWLTIAARQPASAFARFVYSATSALILAPMLWELTFRFQVVSAAGAATILSAYVGIATALAWKRNATSVFWVVNLAAISLALSLFFASRVVVPFISVLLFMLALAGMAESRNREYGARSLNAAAASLAIGAATYIYASPPAARPDYPAVSRIALIAPGFVLLFIYLAGVAFNLLARRRRIAVFEVVQTVIAFLLAIVGFLSFGPRSALLICGIFCLLLAAGAYAAVYLVFDGGPDRRNYRVFSTWAMALFLVFCFMALPPAWVPPSLAFAAACATALGARFSRLALEFQGTIYLAAAAVSSGLAAYTVRALAGVSPTSPSGEVYVTFFFAALCYMLMIRGDAPSRRQQALRLAVASLVVCAAAGLVVQGLLWLAAFHIQTGPHHLALFRTLSICAVALFLAYGGARWRRAELAHIAHAALVLLLVKLFVEDLRHGHLAFIAGSISLFALTLIAVPRVARNGRQSMDSPPNTYS